MALNIGKQIAVLKQMTVRELREECQEVFGEPTRAGNKDFLFKRIAWRIQSLAEGDLSDRARRRADELARDADLRTTAPRTPSPITSRNGTQEAKPAASLADERIPPAGTVLTRVYRGQAYHVVVRDELYDGEHDAIIDEDVWQRVQTILRRNGRSGGGIVKNKYGALLKGLLRCVPCDCAMVHSISSKGSKRYRYSVCAKAMKRGWYTCPSKSVPAGELERFVVKQIRSIGRDASVLSETIRQVRAQSQKAIADLEHEQETLERDIARQRKALRKQLAGAPESNAADVARQREELRQVEVRVTEVRGQHLALRRELVDEREVVQALSLFDPVWESLTSREQARIVRLLVERVDYDGRQSTVSITFHPTEIKTLAQQTTEHAA